MRFESRSRRTLLFSLACTFLLGTAAAPDDAPSSGRLKAQAALKPYGTLVGDWKGTGQPKRGSSRGAWTETAGWAWSLSESDAALELKVDRGQFLKSARLRPDAKAGRFRLEATLADGTARTFTGEPGPRGALVLVADAPGEGPRRVTITPLHEARSLILLEGRAAEGDPYARLAEVGYTRKGAAFAAGESYPLCIVTEGRGTTTVAYQGKTYYVCCSGCKDLFESDPAAILAEAAERDKAKKR